MQQEREYAQACACGANQWSVRGEPLLRAICHCHFCQDFNQAACADILIYRKAQISFADETHTAYRAYSNPPMVQRGSCRQCGKPVLEQLTLPLFPRLTFVPAANLAAAQALPRPALHLFYHRRRADVADSVPKFSGYLRSEIHFMGRVIAALWRSRRR